MAGPQRCARVRDLAGRGLGNRGISLRLRGVLEAGLPASSSRVSARRRTGGGPGVASAAPAAARAGGCVTARRPDAVEDAPRRLLDDGCLLLSAVGGAGVRAIGRGHLSGAGGAGRIQRLAGIGGVEQRRLVVGASAGADLRRAVLLHPAGAAAGGGGAHEADGWHDTGGAAVAWWAGVAGAANWPPDGAMANWPSMRRQAEVSGVRCQVSGVRW